jgi:ABC-type phosphate transport system, periplasmic component
MTKKIGILIRIIITILVWMMGGYVLHKFEYLTAFDDIDNIIGMLPVALVMIATIGTTITLWKKHTKQHISISVVFLLLVILSVALFPIALQGNWWINTTTSNKSEEKPDLSIYIPFSKDSKTAKLDGESELYFANNLPVLDGATALYSVYTAFAEAVYEEEIFSNEYVLCTNTRSAYEAIIAGDRDIIFVAGVSEQQRVMAEEAGADLRFTPIGREAFVFLVGQENPIDNITYQQIRNIYSGKTANWATLGWNEGGRIIAFQRPEGSGSQTGLQMIMDELMIQVPQPLPDASIIGTNSLMKQVSVK